MKNYKLFLITFLFLIFTVNELFSQAGQLDTTFGHFGIAANAINLFSEPSIARGIKIQEDGKILVAGNVQGNTGVFAVARYNADGSLDNTFGINGETTSPIETDRSFVFDLALQNDGKIIVAGYSQVKNDTTNIINLVRYNSDGRLDDTFGLHGIVYTIIENKNCFAYSLSLQNDGKILVAGSSGTSLHMDFTMVRYNEEGSLDNTFGNNGIVITPAGNFNSSARSISIQKDNKIVLSGYVAHGDFYEFETVRYNSNGNIDNAFGNEGFIFSEIGTGTKGAECNSNYIQEDGKIVAAGYSYNLDSLNIALVRYNTNGSLDNTFGINGRVITHIENFSSEVISVIGLKDGKILAGGFCSTNFFGLYVVFARYNTDGSLDDTFGIDGISIQSIVNLSFSSSFSMAIRNNEEILAITTTFDGIRNNFALSGFDFNGNLDNSFGNKGTVTTAFGKSRDYVNSVTLQKNLNDEKIITAGNSWNGSDFDFSLSRFHSNGIIDSSFGINGSITTSINNADDFANSVAVQDDGKIIATGSSFNGNNKVFATVRYNTDGSLDNSFGSGGKVIAEFGTEDAYANSVAVQKDGKIITVGISPSTFGINVTNHVFTFIRYNPDGTLDSDFGINGKVTKRINTLYSEATSVEIEEDGKILAGGLSGLGGHVFALVRLNLDGKLDTTFSNDGVVTTSVGKIEGQTINSSISAVNSIAVQDDGKIIACGYCTNGVNGGDISKDFALVRYNSDGSVDSTFGNDGIVMTSISTLDDIAYSVKVQDNGKIIAGGYTDSENDVDFAIVRYNNDGSLDSTFGQDGIEIYKFGSSNNFIKSMILQDDGNIIAAGYAANNDSSNVVQVVARYLGKNQTTGTSDKVLNETPKLFNLFQNYPNPFNPTTTIKYSVPLPNVGNENFRSLQLIVYDILGREVATLVNKNQQPGNYEVEFNASNLSSGVYFYKLKAGNYSSVKKMILLKW